MVCNSLGANLWSFLRKIDACPRKMCPSVCLSVRLSVCLSVSSFVCLSDRLLTGINTANMSIKLVSPEQISLPQESRSVPYSPQTVSAKGKRCYEMSTIICGGRGYRKGCTSSTRPKPPFFARFPFLSPKKDYPVIQQKQTTSTQQETWYFRTK